jgi:hypothetical protein
MIPTNYPVFAYLGAAVNVLLLSTDYSNMPSKIPIPKPISKASCEPQAGTHVQD